MAVNSIWKLLKRFVNKWYMLHKVGENRYKYIVDEITLNKDEVTIKSLGMVITLVRIDDTLYNVFVNNEQVGELYINMTGQLVLYTYKESYIDLICKSEFMDAFINKYCEMLEYDEDESEPVNFSEVVSGYLQ